MAQASDFSGNFDLTPQARAFLDKRVERLHLQSPSRAVQASYIKVDNVAPTLTAFSTGKTDLDSSKGAAQLLVNFTASDDFAGVSQVTLWVQNATNYSSNFATFAVGYPDKTIKGKLAIDASNLSTGTWSITSLQVSDAAGNGRVYDAAALAQFGGSTSFNVVGASGDTQAPTVVSGKVLTPTVSLSALQKGSYSNQAMAGFSVTVQDTAEDKVSGVRMASATFCSPSAYDCLSFTNAESARGLGKAEIRMATTPYYYYQPTGDYKLTTLSVTDFAGNSRMMTSIEDGGDTDFSTMFPSTTITLVP
ncbi:hypothetical protein GCM10009107_09050 [Ideonella azotifigens]|uniref:Uncharacterized protein n=1 Tax=Ideonella azotifigens TaxID=513160 RepID=A0ABN1JQD7_9BURK